MQDKLIPLIREVERVVTAPYVPSLQVSLPAGICFLRLKSVD